MSGVSNVASYNAQQYQMIINTLPCMKDRNKCYEELHQLLDVSLKNQLEQHHNFLTDAPEMQNCNS